MKAPSHTHTHSVPLSFKSAAVLLTRPETDQEATEPTGRPFDNFAFATTSTPEPHCIHAYHRHDRSLCFVDPPPLLAGRRRRGRRPDRVGPTRMVSGPARSRLRCRVLHRRRRRRGIKLHRQLVGPTSTRVRNCRAHLCGQSGFCKLHRIQFKYRRLSSLSIHK
jgi:hypothetical protein